MLASVQGFSRAVIAAIGHAMFLSQQWNADDIVIDLGMYPQGVVKLCPVTYRLYVL